MPGKSHRSPVLAGILVLSMLIGSFLPASAFEADGDPSSARSGATYLLSILPAGATQWVDSSKSNKSATYSFQVKNTGDSSLPYCDLQLYPWPFGSNWSYNFVPSAPFEVGSGEVRTVLLVIYPAADAEAKRYTFQLKGKGTGDTTNSISINLDVRQYAGVLVKAPQPQTADPGETLEFDFEIQNTGNGKDRFFVVSVEAGVKAIQPYLKDGNNWTTDLAAGKSAIKTVVVPLPFDARTTEGTAGIQLALTARSNFNASREDVNWTFIRINHEYGLALGLSPKSAYLVPGELGEFTITVLNLGNGNDNASLDLTANFDCSGWNVNLGRASLCLAAGRSNSTKLKITPPLNALRGSNYRFDIVARSSGPPFPEEPVERAESLSITIGYVPPPPPIPTVFVYPRPIGPGEVALFRFNLTNRGNGDEMVNITVLEKPAGWYATPDPSQNILMQPYVTQDFGLTVQSSVVRGESLFQSHFVRLQAANAAGTFKVNLTFEIPVGPVYDWDLVVMGLAMVKVNPQAQAGQGFTLSFANTGNAADEVQLSLAGGQASWGRLDTAALSLACGERRAVRLAVSVPESAEPGREYILKIVASSLNGPGLVREVSVSVVVVRLDVSVVPAGHIEIDGQVRKECNVTAGTRLNLTVTVRNDGTDSVRQVNVRFYDNEVLFAERNTSAIGPLLTARFTVQWDAGLPGVHVLRVRLDAGNRLAEADEGNNEGATTVVVREVPPGRQPPPVSWARPVAAAVLLVLAVAAARSLYLRRHRHDRELYESIYGRNGGTGAGQRPGAGRAGAGRRARQKGGGDG